MTEVDIIKAYLEIRRTNSTIPDEVLDFMKYAALDKLKSSKWARYDSALKNLYFHSGFDMLEKLGYPIWENKRDDEYSSAIIEYGKHFAALTPEEKAAKFMHALQVSARGLMKVLDEGNIEIVQ